MLRFDVPPVWSNAARLDGFTTFIIAVTALAGFPYLLPLLIVQGLVRGFIGHSKCPSHRVYVALLEKLGLAGKKENAGAKMFANKLLVVASTIASVLYLAGIPMWVVPVTALALFSLLEWALSFCVACWAYTAWYQLRGQS